MLKILSFRFAHAFTLSVRWLTDDANQDPMMTIGNPIASPIVMGSDKNTTPSINATAGFRYVINVTLTGPISSINAKNKMNASTVQTSASVTTANIELFDGISVGATNGKNGV